MKPKYPKNLLKQILQAIRTIISSPIFIFAVLDVILLSPLLFKRGELMFRDFTFPIFGESFRAYHLPVWNYMIDKVNLDSLYRAFSRLPLIALSYVLPVTIVLRLYIYTIFLVGQLSFYYFARQILKVNNRFVLFLTSFLFVFNSRFLDFLQGISLALVYALIPLLILLIERSLRHKSFFNPNLFLASIVALIMFVHPYALAFVAIFVAFWVFGVSCEVSFRRKVSQLFTLAAAHILLSAYFVFPFAASWLKSGPINPETGGYYKFTYSIVDYLSSSTTLEKLSLTRSVVTYFDLYPVDNFLQIFWFVNSVLLTLVLPGLLIIFRKRIPFNPQLRLTPLIPFYALALLFSFGTQGGFGQFYYFLLDKVPNSLNWLLKSPPKLQLYTVGVLVIILAVVLNVLFQKLNSNFKKRIFGAALLGSIVFYTFYHYAGYILEDRFTPGITPIQYQKINKILSLQNSNSRTIYYPLYNEKPANWSGEKPIEPFDIISSQTPTVSYWWNSKASNDYFFQNIYKQKRIGNICEYLAPMNIQYLVFHNDLTPPFDYLPKQVLNQLLLFYPDKLIYKSGDWYLFDLECQKSYQFGVHPNLKLETNYQDQTKLYPNFNLIKYNQNVPAFDTFESIISNKGKIINPGDINISDSSVDTWVNWQKTYSSLKVDNTSENDNIWSLNPKNLKAEDSVKINFDPKSKAVVETEDNDFEASDLNQNAASQKLLEIKSQPIEIPADRAYKLNLELSTEDLIRVSGSYTPYDIFGNQIDNLELPLKFVQDGQKFKLEQTIFVPKQTQKVTFKLRTAQTDRIEKIKIQQASLSSFPKLQSFDLKINNFNTSQPQSIFAKALFSPISNKINNVETSEETDKSRFQTIYLGELEPGESVLKVNATGYSALQNISAIDKDDLTDLPPFVSFNSSCPTNSILNNDYQLLKLQDNIYLCYRSSDQLLKPEIKDLLDYFVNKKNLQTLKLKPGNSPKIAELDYNATTWLPKSNNFSLAMPLLGNDFLRADNQDTITINGLMSAVLTKNLKLNSSNKVTFDNQLDQYFGYGSIVGLITLGGYFWLCYQKRD